MFAATPGPYLVVAPPDFVVVAVNDDYLQATGTRREEIVGRRLFDLFTTNPGDPDDSAPAGLRASLERVAAEGRPDTMTVVRYDVRRPDGSFAERYWRPHNAPVLNASGDVAFVIHRVEDVTEIIRLRQSRDALDRSGRDRDSALGFLAGGGEMGALMRAHDWSTSPLGWPETWPQSLRAVVSLLLNSKFPMFAAWGPELAFLYNDGYVPIFGAKHPHALGLPFRQVWSEIWHDVGPLVDRAMAGEASFHEDLHLVMERHGFPEDTWYTFSYSPVRDESGGIGGMFCACTETTSKVLTDRRLMAESERLRALFEQAPGFMAVLRGPEHVFELANEAYLDLTGNREIIGKPVREALPEVAGQGYVEILDTVYRTGERFTGRQAGVLLRRAPGAPAEETFLNFVFQPITDAAGAVTGIFIEGAEITDQVRAEAALRRLNETLEQEVQARTRELQRTEEALRQSQKMEALGQLTGGIAHDFNNLLTAVVGGLDIIQTRATDDRMRRLAGNALEAAERGAKLTAQLLAFSRTQRLTVAPVPINAAIAGMRDLLDRTLGSTVEVRTVLDPEAGDVLTDANQLELAVLNLALNARDAMPQGGTITITTSRVAAESEDLDPGESYVAISVADTGTGMTEAVLDKAFEPFFTTKPVGRGTGLGLAQVYGIARQSGGTTRIESRPGEGTTVQIILRAARTRAAAAAAASGGPEEGPEGQASPAQTILVVDDDASVRAFLVDTLAGLGYRVEAAANGEEALGLIDAVMPGLVLLDFSMPEMNGAEVAQIARLRHPALPIVFVTGYADTAALDAALGTDAPVLRKPFRVGELITAIDAALADEG